MNDDNIRKSAVKATRIAVTIYTIVKQVFYMTLFDSVYWLPRTYANIIMLIIVFAIPYIGNLSKRRLSWIIPTALAFTEIVLVASFGGDRLTYILLIGCALVSLLYMDVYGLFITTAASCAAAALCLFVFGYTLIGEAYDFTDDVFNFAGLVVVDFLIFLIGKYGIGTLTKSKQDVEQALLETKAANQAKSSFLATMSHEIRTPMNAILGIAQIQLRQPDIPDVYADAFDKIHNSGNALLGIINDILDLSKIETGHLELHPSGYDIASLINDTVQLNAVRIGSKQIQCIIDVDENLPSRLYGDELRLKQILNNLLSNAVKYTDEGHVKLSVTAASNPNRFDDETELTFTVEDTGRGMKQNDVERLFTEYIRFDPEANRSTEGTGLGLVITKNLVETMDGRIEVKSEYGKGSTFTVTVVQKLLKCAPIGAETAFRLRSFEYCDKKHKDRRRTVRSLMPYGSALIVDDVESNRHVAEGLISPYKLKTDTADSGYAVLDLIKKGKTYDIIFMDHMMPGMDGIETTQRLRDQGYNGTIVALTANALAGNAEMFKDKGFDDFISKPIDIRRLDAVLNKYVRDAHPEEAKKYRTVSVRRGKPGIDTRLMNMFIKEARDAAVMLTNSANNGDIKHYTITAHSMKSSLAGIGEHEASAMAAGLEKAGTENDTQYINDNTQAFIDALNVIIEKHEPAQKKPPEDTPGSDDVKLPRQELDRFIAACEEYDNTAALEILNTFRERKYSAKIDDILEQINTALYLDSDFDEAIKLAGGLR